MLGMDPPDARDVTLPILTSHVSGLYQPLYDAENGSQEKPVRAPLASLGN